MAQCSSITLTVESPVAGTAHVLLFLADRSLADAGAALVSSAVVEVPAGGPGKEVVLAVDPDVQQCGYTAAQMNQPSYYASLDVAKSTLRYAAGPAFGLEPGGKGKLSLRAK